jgi:hypothetical protein
VRRKQHKRRWLVAEAGPVGWLHDDDRTEPSDINQIKLMDRYGT